MPRGFSRHFLSQLGIWEDDVPSRQVLLFFFFLGFLQRDASERHPARRESVSSGRAPVAEGRGLSALRSFLAHTCLRGQSVSVWVTLPHAPCWMAAVRRCQPSLREQFDEFMSESLQPPYLLQSFIRLDVSVNRIASSPFVNNFLSITVFGIYSFT